MTDILDELKALYECEEGSPDFAFVKKTIDEIEQLRAENEKLKERITELGWIASPERMGQ